MIIHHLNFKTLQSIKSSRKVRPEYCSPTKKKKSTGVMPPRIRLQGVDDKLQEILDTNMDEAPARRRAREAFKDIQLNIDHILFKTPTDGLKIKESYDVNSRGLEIFSKSWLPEASQPKAILCYCHGYGDTYTFFFEGIARKLASYGYGVFAMDYPGFGLSEGLHCYIPSFERLVDDVIEHYSKVKDNPDFNTVPNFLFGQSMGGAVALKVHLKQPNAWNGAILVAPMCKIADDMVPPWLLAQVLIGVSKFLPKQKLVPQKNLAEVAFKELKKRELTAYKSICTGKALARADGGTGRTEIARATGRASFAQVIALARGGVPLFCSCITLTDLTAAPPIPSCSSKTQEPPPFDRANILPVQML